LGLPVPTPKNKPLPDGMDARWREGKKRAILINLKYPLETAFKYCMASEHTNFLTFPLWIITVKKIKKEFS